MSDLNFKPMHDGIGGYQIRSPWAIHFLTFTIVDWIDIFTRSCYCDILIENLRFYQQARGLEVFNYVVMSNHMHAILRQPQSAWGLVDTVRDFKKMTARQILEQLGQPKESRRDWIEYRMVWNARQRSNRGLHQIWSYDNHPEEIWSKKFFDQKSRYNDFNPVKAGLVHEPHHWRYSSASDLISPNPLIRLSAWQ